MTGPVPGRGSLAGDIRLTLTGNLVFAFSQWMILIVVARLGSPEQVGYITLATAIATPIFALTGLSLREGRVVDFGEDRADADYFLLRMMMTGVAVVASVLVILGAYGGGSAAFVAAALGFVLTRIPDTQSLLHYGFCQTRGRFDIILRSQVARGVFGLLAFALVFAWTGSIGAAFAVQAVCWAVVIAAVEYRLLAREGVEFAIGRVSRKRLASAGRLALWLVPLAIAGVLQMISLYVPRLVLAEYVSFAALGYFSAIFYILTAVQTLTRAIAQASASRLAHAAKGGNRMQFQRMTLIVLAANAALGGAILIGAYVFGEWVIRVAYGPDYVDIFLIMAAALTAALQLLTGVTQYSLTAAHRFQLRVWINLACLVTAVVLSFLLIPTQGTDGAAWTIIGVAALRLVLGLGVLVWAMAQIAPPEARP